MENFVCSICKRQVNNEWSNNAYPVNEGRCCNDCNNEYVIPARLAKMFENKQK